MIKPFCISTQGFSASFIIKSWLRGLSLSTDTHTHKNLVFLLKLELFQCKKGEALSSQTGKPSSRLGSYSSKSVVRQGPHQISPCKWHISNTLQCLITVISWSVLLLLFFVGLFFVGVEETHDEMVSLLWEIWCCGKKVLLLPLLLYLLP